MLTRVSNVTVTTSKELTGQKIQMNTLFLPGLEGELMKRCSVRKLLTFGNLGPFHCRRSRGKCCMDKTELLTVSLWSSPRWGFVTEPSYLFEFPPVYVLCILISCLELVPSDKGHRSMGGSCQGCSVPLNKINFKSVKDRLTMGQRTSKDVFAIILQTVEPHCSGHSFRDYLK